MDLVMPHPLDPRATPGAAAAVGLSGVLGITVVFMIVGIAVRSTRLPA